MREGTFPYFLANRPVQADVELTVYDKFTQEPAYRTALADDHAIDEAIQAAVTAFPKTRRMPAHQRQAVLEHVAIRIRQRQDELAEVLCVEAGKPIRDARGEISRCLDTFRIAAGEAIRMTGEVLPLDISPRSENYVSLWRRFPIGPCSFISPFNFPLNLAAHKVAPAIAAGNPWILKPASWTPVSALILGEILAETELPEGSFSILPCSRRAADRLTTDERIRLLSFTGSPEVGWGLKARAGKKKVVLELGGNAACIVDESADIASAADRIVFGAFYQSGQSCISVQRVLAHRTIYDELKRNLVEKTTRLKSGDPRDEETFIGPMISEFDARRIEEWVNEAVSGGARVLCGGTRNGVCYDATLLENVDPRLRISCAEAFGPVATLQPFDDFRAAVAAVNDSPFGLQAGVFTRNLEHAWHAYEHLDLGGVILNDVPAFRVDNMPYGGVKDSGLGREGVRFAIEEMTEIKLLVLRQPASA